jgi:hydrogenase maturation protein HypF
MNNDPNHPESSQPLGLLKVHIRGVVQGVGFRPFVYRLAKEQGLKGYVLNGTRGVEIEVEGTEGELKEFLRRLEIEKPPYSAIENITSQFLPPKGYPDFSIKESDETGEKTVLIPSDMAICDDCLSEILDVSNRRHLYPFTNCTNCGPRFSIIENIPYDRSHTTMKKFPMCPECQREYEDPINRRFHAQPNACPECGPQLQGWNPDGSLLAEKDEALRKAGEMIRSGKIVALKGLGGFHLICDARNEGAVSTLRTRKRREAKPLALMFPTLESVGKYCAMSSIEVKLLRSAESPIVLLKKKEEAEKCLADSLAPGNPQLGAMLPYTPIHVLLMRDLDFPVVATSGNLSDEPICIEEKEAIERLKGIADYFLVHNRPIVRPMDDSVARVLMDEVQVIRRARGFSPLPIFLDSNGPTLLAMGGFLKNTVALAKGNRVFISQHLGDLGTLPAIEAFERSVTDLPSLYEAQPEAVACDIHPDYASTRKAKEMGIPMIPVQHHVAHVVSCLAENQLKGDVFGVSWDGTGLGFDNTIWGGEFFIIRDGEANRAGHIRHFPLMGGDRAIKEPRRSALGLLYEVFGKETFQMMDLPTLKAFEKKEIATLEGMFQSTLAIQTSSAGRLFDAVASLADVCQKSRFEGEAAMMLEFKRGGLESAESYPFPLRSQGEGFLLDWEPLIKELFADVRREVRKEEISQRFHNALVEGIVQAAKKAGVEQVVLSGGCFQNRYLMERSVHRLRQEGFKPYWHKQVPPNDGGLSLGQAVWAREILKKRLKSRQP